MLPMSGYPFGPGGYGGLLLFFCHFQIKAEDAAQSDATSRASLSTMSRGELGEVRQTGVIGLIRPTPALCSVSER